MQRKLRVCRLLPPRYGLGALSSNNTDAPASAAAIAAHKPALPPPMTNTSGPVVCGLERILERMLEFGLERALEFSPPAAAEIRWRAS